ncbi:MAG: hypothetical protein NTV23_08995 [Propionibacteriales bacterium]|nr:hypothetical protein [Propionibacteriales bacterium]
MKSHAPRSTAQRRTAVVVALLAPALAACGFSAQTDKIYQAAQGVDDRTTSVKILNAVVVAEENGSGTFAGSFVNESGEAQTLTQVGAEGVTAAKAVAAITVAPRRLLNLGDAVKGPQGGPATVPLLVLTGTPIEIGRFVRLTFEFSGAGKVVLNVPVVSSSSEVGREFENVPLPTKPEENSVPSLEETPAGEVTPEATESETPAE